MATKTTGSTQIKSRKRVKEHGEVFTAKREVKAMCDLVADAVASPETTVLEPACGTGNFLAEILERKMQTICKKLIETEEERQRAVLAVASLYGVDIMEDNVQQTRERLYGIAARYLVHNIHLSHVNDMLRRTLIDCYHVVHYNIQRGDFLADNLVFRFWRYDTLPGSQRISLRCDKITKEEMMQKCSVCKQ